MLIVPFYETVNVNVILAATVHQAKVHVRYIEERHIYMYIECDCHTTLWAILIFTHFLRLARFPLSKTHKQNGVRAQKNVENEALHGL